MLIQKGWHLLSISRRFKAFCQTSRKKRLRWLATTRSAIFVDETNSITWAPHGSSRWVARSTKLPCLRGCFVVCCVCDKMTYQSIDCRSVLTDNLPGDLIFPSFFVLSFNVRPIPRTFAGVLCMILFLSGSSHFSLYVFQRHSFCVWVFYWTFFRPNWTTIFWLNKNCRRKARGILVLVVLSRQKRWKLFGRFSACGS